jgi:GNAT superfamily N-acetyltransferase
MNLENIQIKKLEKQGLDTLMGWASNEGWNPGKNDAKVFWDTDPDGFYGCFFEGRLIGGGAIISYNGEYGFMGLFIVHSDYRNDGIGRKLWLFRRDMLLNRLQPNASIGMDGVLAMQPFYNKGGFNIAFRDERYEFLSKAFSFSNDISTIESNDFDGNYVVDNREGSDGSVDADYILMTFGLKTHELEDANEKVYVNGSFNDWQLDKTNEMIYDNNFGGYTATIRLKQGVYNYNFMIQKMNKTTDESYFEGNFGETQNTYEIFIYHRPVTARAEKLVGYHTIDFNKRK